MTFSSGVILFCISNWFFAVTAGLLWRNPHIEYLIRLFRGEFRRLVILCYVSGAIMAFLGVVFGLLIGAIMGIMLIDPAGIGAIPLIERFSLGGMFVLEFGAAFAIGYACDKLVFSLPRF